MNYSSDQKSSQETGKLRLAFFLTQDSPRTRQTIAALCKLDAATPAAVFLIKKGMGTETPHWVDRLSEGMRAATERALTGAVVSPTQVRQVLQHAFSERYESLEDLAARYGIPLYPVEDLCGAETLARIGAANIDLGVSLDRLSLPQAAVSLMRLGCIDCQKENRSPLSLLIRNLYTLAVYYSGVYLCVRLWHRVTSRSRAAVLLYHRVNPYSKDVLTVDPETFAAQLLAISARYRVTNTSDLAECIRSGRSLRPTTVAIHFDDSYQDVVVNGAPILRALGIPACAFLNSGYIDTTREYPHDIQDSPFRFNKLRSADVLEWINSGCEVGAHTVNHIDLGRCPSDVAYQEARLCGSALETLLHRPIELFAFPYGRPEHMSDENRRALDRAGYRAIFSCAGGFINGRTKTGDIPRMECFYEYAPLHCLLQIEGITLHQLAMRASRVWRTLRRRPHAALNTPPTLQHSRN